MGTPLWNVERGYLTESQPESLKKKVLRQLSDGRMSKIDISRSLGQNTLSGQINKICENGELTTKRLGTRKKNAVLAPTSRKIRFSVGFWGKRNLTLAKSSADSIS